MLNKNLEVIILAAGMGTRMNSSKPKVLHELAGKPMISYLIQSVESLKPSNMVIVIGPNDDETNSVVSPFDTVVQNNRKGTAHAVLAAKNKILSNNGTVLVLFGADPFIQSSTINKMLERRKSGSAIVVLGFEAKDPGKYGRLKLNKSNELEAIIEYKDASEEELSINLCNGGAMAIDTSIIWDLLESVKDDNNKKEYYLTDIISLARKDGLKCSVIKTSESELIGVDSKKDLSKAEEFVQNNLREKFLNQGVTLIDPKTVWFSDDIKFGKDVVIEPNVFFGRGVSIGNNCRIRSFSYIEKAKVGDNVVVGPFARLRPNTILENDVHVGNFVEIKNSNVGSKTKVNHLSYIGDSSLGQSANIGAGTITANYDGINKSKTIIGDKSSIGSNSVLVAPVNIGDEAVVAAGSVVRRDVPEGSLHVESKRSDSPIKENWVKNRFGK